MSKFNFLVLAAGLITLTVQMAGCALVIPRTYTSPDEVTLEQAMITVVCGIASYRNEGLKLDQETGVLVDQIDVTLNLKASATGKSELVIDTSTAAGVGFLAPISANYADKLETLGHRENTIKITFKNVYTSSLNEPGKKKVAEQGPDFNRRRLDEAPVTNPCNPRQKVSDNSQFEP